MEKLTQSIQFIRKNHYLKDAVILLSGNGFKMMIGFFLNIILAKFFGAANYGIYTTLMAISLISVNLSDFGYGNTLNRLLNKSFENKRKILGHIFLLKISLLILLLLIIYQSSDFLAHHLSALNNKQHLIKLLTLVIGFESLFRFLLATLQANHLFKRFSLLIVLNNFFRLAGVIALFAFNNLTLQSIILLYAVFFLLLILFNLNSWKLSFQIDRSLFKIITKYAFWVWLVIVFDTLFVKSDILMINILKYENVVIGNYSLILTFISTISLLQMSVFTQLLPKTSQFQTKSDYKKYYSDIKYIRAGAVLISAIYIIVLPFVLKFLYANQYEINPIIIFIFGIPFLMSLFNEFNSVLLYAIEKHHFISYSKILGLILLICILFISRNIQTVLHVVTAVMTGKIVVELIIYLKVKQCLKSLPD